MIRVSWQALKQFATDRSLSIQYVDADGNYNLAAFDGAFGLDCVLNKAQNLEEVADFEANFKTAGNQSPRMKTVLDDGNGNVVNQLDTDNALIVRIKAAKRGWSYWSVPIEIVTSTLGASLFAQDSLGVVIPWITARIYDSEGAEITTAGLLNANLAQCVKTVVDFEPTFNYEIIGGSLRINSNPSVDCRLWIVAAPDVPANLGGSKEFASGINMKFLSADNSWDVDGRVAKAVTYDPIYHSGKLRMIIKHPPGLQVNLMFVAQLFRQ